MYSTLTRIVTVAVVGLASVANAASIDKRDYYANFFDG
jgi:hypothetical protein